MDPALGPLAEPAEWHSYAYAANNPLRYLDPFGLEKVIILYGDRYRKPTAAFYAAAYSLKETYLARGYSEEDILFRPVRTTGELLDAVRNSGEGEIEHMAIFSHGYPTGLQLSAPPAELAKLGGHYADPPWRQFESDDVDPSLRSRFAVGADFEMHSCYTGRGDLAQTVADAWGIEVSASTYATKFWTAWFVTSIAAEEAARGATGGFVPVGPVGIRPRVVRVGTVAVPAADLLVPFEGGRGYHAEYVLQLPEEGESWGTRIRSYTTFRPRQ